MMQMLEKWIRILCHALNMPLLRQWMWKDPFRSSSIFWVIEGKDSNLNPSRKCLLFNITRQINLHIILYIFVFIHVIKFLFQCYYFLGSKYLFCAYFDLLFCLFACLFWSFLVPKDPGSNYYYCCRLLRKMICLGIVAMQHWNLDDSSSKIVHQFHVNIFVNFHTCITLWAILVLFSTECLHYYSKSSYHLNSQLYNFAPFGASKKVSVVLYVMWLLWDAEFYLVFQDNVELQCESCTLDTIPPSGMVTDLKRSFNSASRCTERSICLGVMRFLF